MSQAEETDRMVTVRCRQLARHEGLAGNSVVGSVVASTGQVLAEAEEQTPAGPVPFGHAGLLAVQRAIQVCGNRPLAHATLYSTREPCWLCAYAIRATWLGRVVIEQAGPEIGGVTSKYPILTTDDISIWGQPRAVLWIDPPSCASGSSPPRDPGLETELASCHVSKSCLVLPGEALHTD